jgi:uncharacterized protein (DUF1697 family)
VTRYIALLRAVNVGGNTMVAMSDLRAMCEKLGFEDVETLLQSGNIVFRSSARSGASLEKTLEAEAKKRLGLETHFIVRAAAEWRAAIDANPFPAEAKSDPGHLLLMCLKDAPPAKSVKALQAAIGGRERVRAVGNNAYFVYPDGVGTSRLTAKVIEKHLGTSGTARNWNTTLKLAARVAE